ncbi:hypothetical protein AAVH_33478, partial [Aphelenchoides avenae]
ATPADLRRVIFCMRPGLSRFTCGLDNITPAHVTDQCLNSLASKGVNEAAFFSTDPSVYFDVSDESILRFCFCSGCSEARRLVLYDVRVTQHLFDRLVEAHRDSNNCVDLDLIINDSKMPEIVYAGHTERIEDEHETTYVYVTDEWTMETSAMMPAEVLENILLFLTRQQLDKLVCLSSGLASVLLDDSFAAKSPLRSVTRLMLLSLQEVIIIVASTGGAKEFRSSPSDDIRALIHLCFFRDVTVNASGPELVQWVCAHRAILNGDKLIVPTPLASFELFNVRSFRRVALDSDHRCSRDEWRFHRGPRRLVSLQCDLLRDCELLTGGHFHAVSDFVFDVRDVAQWLHRRSEKGRELTLDVELLGGDAMSLIEMLEEVSSLHL